MDEQTTAQLVIVENTYDALMVILKEKRFDLAYDAIENLREESLKLKVMLKRLDNGE